MARVRFSSGLIQQRGFSSEMVSNMCCISLNRHQMLFLRCCVNISMKRIFPLRQACQCNGVIMGTINQCRCVLEMHIIVTLSEF